MQTALIHRMRRTLLALVILCLLMAVPALAVNPPVAAQITVTPDEMSVPGPVDVSISVTNISGADLKRPVTLYDPNGKIVSGFGQNGSATMKKDAQMTISLQGSVTQEMLDAGQMTYNLRWMDEDGQEMALPVTAEVHFNGERSGLHIVRTISPEVVRSGHSVKVTYELTNTGAVSISNIQVKEKLSRTPKTLKNLAIGATTKVEFTAKMGNSDLVSSAEISYRPAGTGKTETVTIEEQTIPLAVPGLNVELSVDRTAVDIGESVRLVLTARNEGNITYSHVSATDKKLGTVFENLTFPANQTVTEEKEITITEPSSFELKLALDDNTGTNNSYTTNKVSVSAYDPAKELLLTLLLTADRDYITSAPEDLSMTVAVTNTSNVDCKDVKIKQNELLISTIPTLAAGQTMIVKRDFTVSQAGSFRFKAEVKDTIGNSLTFESNTLTLNYARVTPVPTSTPVPTVPPLETLPPVDYENTGTILRTVRNVLYTASLVLGSLAAVTLILFLASTIVRAGKRHQSDQAYDHLDLAERRDYAQPPEDQDDQAPAARKPEDRGGDDASAPAEDASMQTEAGGFRMTRDRQTEDFPTWREPGARTDAPETAEAPASEQPAAPEQTAAPEPTDPAPEANPTDAERTALPDRRRRRSNRR